MKYKKELWAAAGTGAALLGAVLVNEALTQSWKKVKKKDPPENPASSDVTWIDALLWGGITGLAMGLTKIVARRGAAAGWKKATGHNPPED